MCVLNSMADYWILHCIMAARCISVAAYMKSVHLQQWVTFVSFSSGGARCQQRGCAPLQVFSFALRSCEWLLLPCIKRSGPNAIAKQQTTAAIINLNTKHMKIFGILWDLLALFKKVLDTCYILGVASWRKISVKFVENLPGRFFNNYS